MTICVICKEEKIRFIRPNGKRESNHDFNKRQTCGKKTCRSILRNKTHWAKAMIGFTKENLYCFVCGTIKQQRIRTDGNKEGIVQMLERVTCSNACLILHTITKVYRDPISLISKKQSIALNSFLY